MNQPLNMSDFIAPKSDQLNADDLIGGSRTIRITGVSANEGSPEQPISVSFENDNRKPYKPCKSMRRVMVHCWGPDAKEYVGRSMTIYRDPEVMFGGMKVGGIRISHMSHIDGKKTMALTATRAKRAPYTVEPLADTGKRRDAAAEYAEALIGSVEAALSIDTLDQVIAERGGRLAELREKRPELAQRCDAAIQRRRDDLSENTRRTDAQHGDQFDGQPAAADDF